MGRCIDRQILNHWTLNQDSSNQGSPSLGFSVQPNRSPRTHLLTGGSFLCFLGSDSLTHKPADQVLSELVVKYPDLVLNLLGSLSVTRVKYYIFWAFAFSTSK